MMAFRRTDRGCSRGLLLGLVIWLGLWSDLHVWGQDEFPLPVTYGSRSRRDAARSLNGVSGFAQLIEARGTDVQSWYKLSPRIESVDCLVWFPDSRQTLREDERLRFEQWLEDGWQRTLVIVGRDYDATLDYLEVGRQQSTGAERQAYERLWSQQVVRRHLRQLGQDQRTFDGWVAWERGTAPQPSRQLTGPWAEGLDLRQTRVLQGRYPTVPLASELDPEASYQYRTLLSAEGKPFVIEITDPAWNEGRVLVVSNASFLLNYGLTFPGNVRLANRLVDELNLGQRVMFLESQEQGLRVVDREQNQRNTLWDWIQQWPFQFFVPHFLVLGVLFYFVYLPIFGRPHRPPVPSSTDFGQHVAALGELMEKTHDQSYAVRHLKHYHEQVRRESGGVGMRRVSR